MATVTAIQQRADGVLLLPCDRDLAVLHRWSIPSPVRPQPRRAPPPAGSCSRVTVTSPRSTTGAFLPPCDRDLAVLHR
ncbi:hypothetical protein ABZP36_021112 [Zizania latifolia]